MKGIFKKLALIIALAMMVASFAACGGETKPAENETKTEEKTEEGTTPEETAPAEDTAGMSGQILVVSREDGSGTRGAFTEITGVLKDDVDNTVATAQISQGTNEVITFVAGAKEGIGYISLGSLNDTVKALKIEGVEATTENIISGAYKIARPFNICYPIGSTNELRDDFIKFIFSDKGEGIINEEGYIPVEAQPYTKTEGLSGKITIQGSTSVAPVMEKMIAAYKEVQPDITVEMEANGSGAGITAATEGNADIGMASRGLKPEELEKLEAKAIAQDGIAVIVNNENTVEDLTVEQVRQIFTGEVADWSEIK